MASLKKIGALTLVQRLAASLADVMARVLAGVVAAAMDRVLAGILAGILAIAILTCGSACFAGLGETLLNDSQLKTERARLAASSFKSTREVSYATHELVIGLNTIREYTNSDGVVFAVTWVGASHPDLENLFGAYYSEFQNANDSRLKSMGRSQVLLKTARLVVRRGGHMRAIRGSAIVPDLVPEGVNVEALP